MTVIPVEQFHGTADSRTPLFNRDPGWLKTLQNMRVKPGGWLEARGGQEILKPSGGTGAAVSTSGAFLGAHQHTMEQCNLRCLNASDVPTTGSDYGNFASVLLWDTAATAEQMLANYSRAWGASGKFTGMSFYIEQPAIGTYTITWKYSKTTGWGTLTGPTENFTVAGERLVTWSTPSDWAPQPIGDYLGTGTNYGDYRYWIKAEVTSFTSITQRCWLGQHRTYGDWPATSDIVCMTGDRTVASSWSLFRQYMQNPSGTAFWFDIDTSLSYVGRGQRTRFLSHRDRLYFVNGYEQRRYIRGAIQGAGGADIGFPAPAPTVFTITAAAAGNNFGQACVFDYGITFKYGPLPSEWGESAICMSQTGPTTFAAGDQAQLAFNFATWPVNGLVDTVNIYRTQDLTNVPATSRAEQPMFLIQTLTRTLAGVITGTVVDYTYQFPFPAKELDITDRTPPAQCSFIGFLNGRMVLAKSRKYPNRVWWSKAGEMENFDAGEDGEGFAELRGQVTGIATTFDMIFAWSEDEMIFVSDLNEDIPNVGQVPGGVGCVAGDAVRYDAGMLIWPSRDGIYAMTANSKPERITPDHGEVFGKMSVVTHGGSIAAIYDGMYDIHLLSPEGAPVGTYPHWRFDLVKPHWNTTTVSRSPLAVVKAPLGHADYGVPHPLFGNVNPLVADRTPYIGEYTTTDAGTGYDCIADIHFGPRGMQKFEPRRFAAYYQADGGWASPTAGLPPGASYIFSTPAGFGTPTPIAGTDYKLVVANATSHGGAQDIVIRFKATTQAGGTERNQRVAACYLDGSYTEIQSTG